ncbi:MULTISPECIES: DUF6143 family protein [unclassified Mesobacillus]|jgi:hypothetical protein|uniref:DUF6143 family protein n=1 Tax=unclassified Mesobacillus TaxID=2675270 RepID=UPI00203B7775|nr:MULTISPECIES: DUF6143 family protein [unclassified Mesobacillus]MCM3125219.1 DUF6143 family protein [Mesobacillus sp. MER 33]MCM3235350.1 DUF6143 family protein [Mesobacillus sp. MER 48]
MPNEMDKQTIEVVNVTSPALNSRRGKYFIGKTGLLNFGGGYYAWGGIVNPADSGVNVYIDIFTITNLSNQNFISEIWLNAVPPRNAAVSSHVTPTNQAISPSPHPKAILKYAGYSAEPMAKGVNIFDRIVAQNSTLVSDSHNGSIIIGPGDSFSILLRPPGYQYISGTIVLTWWEEAANA